MSKDSPSLFGLSKTNRDFSKKESWGKNQFNSSLKRLNTPIITKSEIKNIILGGGQHMLSPERRFDAIIFNSPELFKS